MGDVLRTERLVLRPWSATDLDAYFDIYSRWDVMQYLGNPPRTLGSREEAAERLAARGTPDPAGPPYGSWAVCEQDGDRPVGTVLLRQLPWSATVDPVPQESDVEVGWHLHPAVWGRGYATEAARTMLDRAWSHGVAEVHAVTYPENASSQAVCCRLGMAYVGRTVRYYDVELDLFRIDLASSARRADL